MTASSVPVIRDRLQELEEILPNKCSSVVNMHSSEQMPQVNDESVSLVVTSPPYPMVEMWDEFGTYTDQHEMIADVMSECYDKLHEGGIMAINIGDATRSKGGRFRYYPNRAQIETTAEDIGFAPLIPIIWRKPTNKPNSFMGSGMKPANAYVTNEVEYILILRKGGNRKFKTDKEKLLRNASRYTQQQRNEWYSQIWDVQGHDQTDGRAQFPFEIPYRLIRMFTIFGDTILDPFAGTGTTLKTAKALGRHSVGYEINKDLKEEITDKIDSVSGITTRDVFRNQIRVDRDRVDPDVFCKNPNSLVEII